MLKLYLLVIMHGCFFGGEIMFIKGDYVVKKNDGICKITDIIRIDMGTGEKDYYILVPIDESEAKIYVPVDIAEKRVRYAINKDEAWRIIRGISSVDEAIIENEKEREKLYKEAINSCDPEQLISIIKTLYLRMQKRLEKNKKNTAVDERYFKLAENQLYGELEFALGVPKSELIRIIEQNIE